MEKERQVATWQEETKIKEVKQSQTGGDIYFDLHLEDSGAFHLKDAYHVIPKVGDLVQLKTRGFSTVAGVKLNGKILYEKTELELDEEHNQWCENQEKKKKEEYARTKHQLDADYDALPPIFQKRIDRFRKNNPDFRWDCEPYVLFAAKEAVKIANACKTVPELAAFHKLDYSEQKAKAGIDEGHSGGTFGEAMQLAHAYLVNEKYVPFVHSSLARIAGCEKIGCLPATEEEMNELGIVDVENGV